MRSLISTTGWTSIVAVALSTAAVASDSEVSLLVSPHPEVASWSNFSAAGNPVSLAWSGEDESLLGVETLLGTARETAGSEGELDVEVVTALPAPEPPALAIAGAAFGGVVFGRSLISRRRRK